MTLSWISYAAAVALGAGVSDPLLLPEPAEPLEPQAAMDSVVAAINKPARTFLKAFIFVSLSLQLIFAYDKTFA